MNSMENIPIEQLWYMWSDVGLSSIHAGFRVRAASAGLTEIYSERVKSMDRYMRYVLPPGTNQGSITPEMAPIGLAFIRTDWNEYILVHKNYSGKDGVGRPGNFFVHVLAAGEYSGYFSAEDAIWLWDSDLWKTNDQSLDRRSTTLDTLPLRMLDSNPRFHPQYAQVHHALSFAIEAYLTRKGKTPLYIAAPAHQTTMIAYVIAGLTGCLPKQLLADLTFSTYEPDIARATTEIVGTSWIAAPGHAGDASQVLPEQWYRDHLAINCATGEHSRLMGHPQINASPLAAHFAAYAADCLVADTMQQLEDLCELAEKSQALTVELFLQLYNDEIANTESIGEVEIERNLSNPDLYLDRLNSQVFRKKIIDRVLANPQWGETRLAPILSKLCAQAEHAGVSSAGAGTYAAPVPEQQQAASLTGPQKSSKRKNARAQTKEPRLTLTLALAQLAKRAIPEAVDTMRQVVKAQKKGINTSDEQSIERSQIIGLIKVMDSCLTTQDPSEVWQTLFMTIIASPSATTYLKTQWDIRFWLLRLWNKALPVTEYYDNAIHPLIGIPWSRFGTFLKVNLSGRHRQWPVFAVEGALTDPSLTPQIAQDLAQNFSGEIYTLLSQLLQDANYTIATDLLIKLVEQGYQLGSSVSTLIEQLLTLLNRNGRWLPAKELVVALTYSGYVGLATTHQSQVEELLGHLLTGAPVEGNALLDLLIKYKYPRKKALLDLLLKTGRADMERSIKRVYRTPEEQNEFFLHDAAPLLKQRDAVQAMVSLYWQLLRDLPQDGKMERLFVLLEGSLDEKTILSLLEKSSLTQKERVQLLEEFGSRYLIVAQQAPRLAQCMIDWFDRLVQVQYPNGAALLFHLMDPRIDSRYLEHLLKTASLSVPESQQLFKEYGRAAGYVPFFRQSPTALALFAQFALAVNNYAGTNEWQQLSKEKMDVLFAWLDPSTSFSDARAIEQILREATLVSEEQISFLDAYGTGYLSLARPRILMEYISTYAFAFTTDDLERAETQPFFTTLKQYYQQLPLDDKTRTLIQYWQTISSYLTASSTRPEVLSNLTKALFNLNLPNNAPFTARLAQAFVFCIRAPEDLANIMTHMHQIPKLKGDDFRFLYTVAEQAATYYQEKNALLPYLLFALTWDEQHTLKHFRNEFLDTLLRDVQETDLATWKRLHAIVMQPRLPPEAVERWEFYLDRLGLLDQLNKADDTTKRSWPSFGRKNKRQSAKPAPHSYQTPASEPPEQHSPSAPRGRIMPHKKERVLDIGGSSSAANPSQGGTSFHIQGKDNKKGPK